MIHSNNFEETQPEGKSTSINTASEFKEVNKREMDNL